jgi:hypothetical protein
MEIPAARQDVTIAHADLQEVTRSALLRLASAEGEAARADHLRAVLQAALALSGSLRSYGRCGLVNGQGTPGAGDLAHETAEVFVALHQFAELVRASAAETRGLAEVAAAPRADRARPAPAPSAASWRRAG